MFSKTKLDLDAIPGVQEIEDSTAELYVGGEGFAVRRIFSQSESGNQYTPLAGLSFDGFGVRAIELENHEGTGQFFAIYGGTGQAGGDHVNLRNFLIAGQTAADGVGVNHTGRIAVAYGDTPEQARLRALNTLNGFYEANGNVQNPSSQPPSIRFPGLPSSDRRIKTAIEVVGFHEELGIKLYSWQYRNDDPTRYVGVMAQDLLARPDLAHAVVIAQAGEFAGYYAVNYEVLGLRMTTEAEWQAQGIAAIVDKPLAVCI